MESLGFRRLGRAEDMAVMGIFEVLKHYRFLKSIFYKVVEAIKEEKPDVAILLDYPGFNLKLSEKLKQLNVPVVYYISPQIWAWKQDRVRIIRKNVNEVLCLFPFEEKFYQNENVTTKMVGHPLLDEMHSRLLVADYRTQHRARFGFTEQDQVLGLMPGSRRSELAYNLPTQLLAAEEVVRKNPKTKVILLVAPNFSREDIEPYLENVRIPIQLVKDEPFEMIHLVDVMLATSGTATLMVGLLEKPMVVMYKVHWLTAILGRWLMKSKFFCIVNLIVDREVVPERLQEQANVQELSSHLLRFFGDPAYYQKTKEELAQLRHLLGDRGATKRVAQEIEKYFIK